MKALVGILSTCLVISIITSLGLFRRQRTTQMHLDRRELEAIQTVRAIHEGRLERQELLRALSAIPYAGIFLGGRDVISGRDITLKDAVDGLYYVVDSRCGACKAGQPFVDSIGSEFPGSVTILSFNDSESTLDAYADSTGASFRALVNPSGYLALAIPRHVSPVTATVLHGKLQSILIGIPSPQDKAAIRLALAPRPIARARQIRGRPSTLSSR